MSFTLIETKTLASAAASIEFTSIPQDGTDLLILSSLRSNASADHSNGNLTFNGSTSGYSERMLFGTGTSAITVSTSGSIIEWSEVHPAANFTANTFGNGRIYIPNYTAAVAKSVSSEATTENNATTSLIYMNAALWNNTAAITSLMITASTGSFIAGSTISLYKITKGSDGIVTTS